MKKVFVLLSVIVLLSLTACQPVVQEPEVVTETIIETKLDATPRLAVASAFDSELQLLLEKAEITNTYVIAGTTYHVGTLNDANVVMYLTGVSMINASMKTQALIDYFTVEAMMFSGIAGGVNPNYNIGDVVVPKQWGQYMESTMAREIDGEFVLPFGGEPEFPNFGMMYPGSVSVVNGASEPDQYETRFWFPADDMLLALANEVAETVDLADCATDVCLSYDPQIHVGGNGVSGQAFVDNAELRDFAWSVFEADALDMETASFAQVAYTNDIPYIAFRSLSDLAGGGEGENEIGTFFQLAADNSATVLLAFIDAYANQ